MPRPEPISLTLADVRLHVKDRALASEALVTLLQLEERGEIHIYPDTGWGLAHDRTRRAFFIYGEALGVRVSLKWWLERWLRERQEQEAATSQPEGGAQ